MDDRCVGRLCVPVRSLRWQSNKRMSSWFRKVAVFLLPCLLMGDVLGGEQGQGTNGQDVKLDPQDAKLLVYLQQRSDKEALLARIDPLIHQLGHGEFEKREEASREIVILGPIALPKLQAALKSEDREVANRAQDCIEQIEKAEKMMGTPREVIECLLKRRPAGTIAVLVRFLPYAGDVVVEERIYFGLDSLLEQAQSLDPVILSALTDKEPARRAAAGLFVGRLGNADQKATVRKLLDDPDKAVRLRTAQGLLAGLDKSSLLTLVDLLEKTPPELAWQAEELLRCTAGPDAPKAVLGKATDGERRLCRAAWERWWKEQVLKLDLTAVQKSNRRPGLVLALEEPAAAPEPGEREYWGREGAISPWIGRVWLCGWDGQPRCEPFILKQMVSELGSKLLHERVFVSGLRSIHPRPDSLDRRFKDLELLRDRTDQERRNWKPSEREPKSSQFITAIGNGSRLVALETEAPNFGVNRLIEMDAAGRTVWESAHEHPVGGVLVWPLVRIGFRYPPGESVNIDRPEHRKKQLSHPDPVLRHLAWEKLEGQPLDEGLLRSAALGLRDVNLGVRRHSAARMMEGGTKARMATADLIALLDDPDELLWRDTMVALQNCGLEMVPGVIAAFENRKGPNVSERRRRAIMILGSLVDSTDERVHRILKSTLLNGDLEMRAWVIIALGNEREKARGYVRKLIDLIDHPKLGGTAIRSLGRMPKAAVVAVPALLKGCNNDAVLGITSWTLGEVTRCHPEILPLLLKQTEPKVAAESCAAATYALGSYDGDQTKTVVAVLIMLLADERKTREDRWKAVQSSAISALQGLGPKAQAAVPALVQGLQSGQFSEFEYLALQALEVIEPEQGKRMQEMRHKKMPLQEPPIPRLP